MEGLVLLGVCRREQFARSVPKTGKKLPDFDTDAHG